MEENPLNPLNPMIIKPPSEEKMNNNVKFKNKNAYEENFYTCNDGHAGTCRTGR